MTFLDSIIDFDNVIVIFHICRLYNDFEGLIYSFYKF